MSASSTDDANDPMLRHQPRQLRAIGELVRSQAAVEQTNASDRVEFVREEKPTCPCAPGKARALVEITEPGERLSEREGESRKARQ
jgi:hypothetical protein